MTLKLRTTICINMLVLMIAAIGLISMVVFRVSENEIRLQQQHAADQVFIAITATLDAVLRDSSAVQPKAVNLKAYLNLLASTMDCDILILTDRNGRTLASLAGFWPVLLFGLGVIAAGQLTTKRAP